jgi:hypothetical protein
MHLSLLISGLLSQYENRAQVVAGLGDMRIDAVVLGVAYALILLQSLGLRIGLVRGMNSFQQGVSIDYLTQ